MLGDDQRLRLGQIEHLARAAPRGHRRRQRQTAGPTGLGVVVDGDVRIGDLVQGLAFVALLPAGRFAGWLAQTAGAPLPLRLVQPVAGRRLAAVGTVQSKPTLQLHNPCHQRRDGLLERRVPGPKPRILLRQRRRGGGLMGGSSAGSVLGRSHGEVDSYAESRVNSFLERATWAVTRAERMMEMERRCFSPCPAPWARTCRTGVRSQGGGIRQLAMKFPY